MMTCESHQLFYSGFVGMDCTVENIRVKLFLNSVNAQRRREGMGSEGNGNHLKRLYTSVILFFQYNLSKDYIEKTITVAGLKSVLLTKDTFLYLMRNGDSIG